MRIPKLEKTPCPPGYVHLDQAIKTLGKARYRGAKWSEQRYVRALPYHIGTTDGRPSLDTYMWKFKSGRWTPYEEYDFFPPNHRKRALGARKQFLGLANDLLMAVERNRVGVRFRNVHGDHSPTKALKAKLVGQAKYVTETGRLLIRIDGKKDELWFVFFEKKGVERLARGDGERTWRIEYRLTAAESVARAKTLVLEMMPKVEKAGISLRRDDFLDILDRVLKREGGAMQRALFEAHIWRKQSNRKLSWFEEQGFKKLRGRQNPFREAAARNFVEAFVEEQKAKRRPDQG